MDRSPDLQFIGRFTKKLRGNEKRPKGNKKRLRGGKTRLEVEAEKTPKRQGSNNIP